MKEVQKVILALEVNQALLDRVVSLVLSDQKESEEREVLEALLAMLDLREKEGYKA